MTINKKNFRNTLATLAFGALVAALPASAANITLSSTSAPTTIQVGSYDFSFGDVATSALGVPTAGNSLTYLGTAPSNSLGWYTLTGDTGATAGGSQVIDIDVTPTIGGAAQTPVQFQATIEKIGTGNTAQYELVFGASGTTACTAASCFSTGNGNLFNNGQTVMTAGALAGDTVLTVGNQTFAVTTTTLLGPTKTNYLGGFYGITGVVTSPEPATYATTGLAAAILGMFLRRKKQNS